MSDAIGPPTKLTADEWNAVGTEGYDAKTATFRIEPPFNSRRDTAPDEPERQRLDRASSTAAGVVLPNLCGMFGDLWDGPCVLSGGHFGPCYGEGDVGDE
jgi:hypothetical protein